MKKSSHTTGEGIIELQERLRSYPECSKYRSNQQFYKETTEEEKYNWIDNGWKCSRTVERHQFSDSENQQIPSIIIKS